MSRRPNFKNQIQEYILSCINTEYLGLPESASDKQKLAAVHNCFVNEYWSNLYTRRIYENNERRGFAGWLAGLPTAINIDFKDFEILDLGYQWLAINKYSSKAIVNSWVGGWFNRITLQFFDMKDGVNHGNRKNKRGDNSSLVPYS